MKETIETPAVSSPSLPSETVIGSYTAGQPLPGTELNIDGGILAGSAASAHAVGT
ncbi:MAG: hypothetical protein R6V60_21760 [Desulfobacterales bacterium]